MHARTMTTTSSNKSKGLFVLTRRGQSRAEWGRRVKIRNRLLRGVEKVLGGMNTISQDSHEQFGLRKFNQEAESPSLL